MTQNKYAILSVFGKEGIVDFANGLLSYDFHLLSSGGTASLLKENGIPVTNVSDYTGSPEILDGRVKTLHPKIYGGILARPTPDHQQEIANHHIGPIDLVVVNLYPFQETANRPEASNEEIIEMIDIGGPSMVRAAAKNYERVAVVIDPADYAVILKELAEHQGRVSAELREQLAAKAFHYITSYDACISNYFNRKGDRFPEFVPLQLQRTQSLRYGENPHQRAALYTLENQGVNLADPSIVRCEQLQGKELSYNNILDADAALNLVLDLPDAAVGIVKHNNPCGAASEANDDVTEAFRKARATDPVSAFGGIVASNRKITAAFAQEAKELFLEAMIAPEYDPEALAILNKKKQLRLLRYLPFSKRVHGLQMRSVSGGMLLQEADSSIENLAQARVVTKRQPTPEELKGLDFAWRVGKHVKSNAITLAIPGQLVGVGAGQMSRVDSVKLAISKAQLPVAGTMLASDAFFPFRDGIDVAAQAGVTAIVQPGGSIRDEEAIAAADEHNIAMIFTGVRHFKH